MSVLDRELETFHRELPNLLLSDAGRYALVHGDKVDSAWSTWEDAVQAGYRLFGLEPFLVKQISLIEEAFFTTKDIAPPCPSSTCQ